MTEWLCGVPGETSEAPSTNSTLLHSGAGKGQEPPGRFRGHLKHSHSKESGQCDHGVEGGEVVEKQVGAEAHGALKLGGGWGGPFTGQREAPGGL